MLTSCLILKYCKYLQYLKYLAFIKNNKNTYILDSAYHCVYFDFNFFLAMVSILYVG